jgi:hypothetical protein
MCDNVTQKDVQLRYEIMKHYAVIAAMLCLMVACDRSPDSEQTDSTGEPTAPNAKAGADALPDEYRQTYEAELAEGRKLHLELPALSDDAPDGDGTSAIDEALEPIDTADADVFGDDYTQRLGNGADLPERVVALLDQHRDTLETLDDALQNTTFSPTILVDERANQPEKVLDAFVAAKLMAADAVTGEPEACGEKAADILRFARANTYGQGMVGLGSTLAVMGIGTTTARGCVARFGELSKTAVERLTYYLEKRSPFIRAVYFEWIAQIPLMAPAIEADLDTEFTADHARKAIEYRLNRLRDIRQIDEDASYEEQLEAVRSLLDDESMKGNPLTDFDAQMRKRYLENEEAYRKDLRRILERDDQEAEAEGATEQ